VMRGFIGQEVIRQSLRRGQSDIMFQQAGRERP
jgi:hypothetical protein